MQSNNLSVLSNTSISLIIIFVMTWKVMHNLSDAAVNIRFCFLKRLLDLMARMIHCKALKQISNLLPQSLYMIRKYLGINRDDIEKLIVCPKCSSCYKSEDCVQTLSNEWKKGERCSFVEFPHHPHRSQRRPSGAALFKAVHSKHRELILKATRVFCYCSVKKTLQEFLKLPGFSEKYEQYKKRPQDPNFLGDIYDGMMEESGRISRVQKESSSLMPQILQLNIEKVWNSKLTLELTCSFCNLLTNATFNCYLLSFPTQGRHYHLCSQIIMSISTVATFWPESWLLVFKKWVVSLYTCPMVWCKWFGHSFSGSAVRWVGTFCGSNLVLNFSN